MQTVLASENTLGPDSSNALPPLAGCCQCFRKAVARGSWYRRTEGIQLNKNERMNGDASSLTLNSAVFALVGRLYVLLLSSHRAKQQQCEVCALFHVAEREKQWRNYSACTKGARKKIKEVTTIGCAMTTFPSVTSEATTATRDKSARARFSARLAIISAPSLKLR